MTIPGEEQPHARRQAGHSISIPPLGPKIYPKGVMDPASGDANRHFFPVQSTMTPGKK